ncbi:hypothetical protein KIW84_012291 [Lathyrus oleraceus]|uniref:Uncharacterized protein n=1 Tax=Pisum sativum TaxID=3888 RepID=A0A9D5BHA5_PEA|nr:hypothetical protein KIW84_012291 [Pisum sativum]
MWHQNNHLWETCDNQFMAYKDENTTGGPKIIIITHLMCQQSSSVHSYVSPIFFIPCFLLTKLLSLWLLFMVFIYYILLFRSNGKLYISNAYKIEIEVEYEGEICYFVFWDKECINYVGLSA